MDCLGEAIAPIAVALPQRPCRKPWLSRGGWYEPIRKGAQDQGEMKRRQPPSRVMLNPAAVWRLLDELDMSQNELARRCGITSGHLSLLDER